MSCLACERAAWHAADSLARPLLACPQVLFAPGAAPLLRGECVDRFGLRRGDFVIPVSSKGLNRAQVLWRVLSSVASRAGAGVENPHGAHSGCDPVVPEGGVTADNYYGYSMAPLHSPTHPGQWVRCGVGVLACSACW